MAAAVTVPPPVPIATPSVGSVGDVERLTDGDAVSEVVCVVGGIEVAAYAGPHPASSATVMMDLRIKSPLPVGEATIVAVLARTVGWHAALGRE